MQYCIKHTKHRPERAKWPPQSLCVRCEVGLTSCHSVQHLLEDALHDLLGLLLVVRSLLLLLLASLGMLLGHVCEAKQTFNQHGPPNNLGHTDTKGKHDKLVLSKAI